MSAAELVFGDGDTVVAMGRLVRDGADWWLDSQRVSTLASRTSGARSERSTRLVGADAHVTALQKQDRLAAKSWVHVIGRWQRDTISVEAIGAGAGRPDPHGEPPSDDADLSTLDPVVADLEARTDDWAIERWGVGCEQSVFVVVELFRVTPEVAGWADAQPAGRVRLDPSVRPHGRSVR